MKILFPTDLSEASQKALKYFKALAKDLDVQISVFSAYTSSTSPSRPFIEQGSYRKQIVNKVKSFVTDGAPSTTSKVRYSAREGFPVQTILEQSHHYDLIVMSKNESYSWLEQWSGSRSFRVARRSKCPVLVLPHNANFQDIEDIWPLNMDINWSTHPTVQLLQNHWKARIHLLPSQSESKYESPTILHSTSLQSMLDVKTFVKEAGIELLVLKLENNWQDSNPLDRLSKTRIFHNLQLPILVFNGYNLAP